MTQPNFMKDHLTRNRHRYASGVLNPKDHFNLVEGLSAHLEAAGIPEQYVVNPVSNYCSGGLVEWLLHIPSLISIGKGHLTLVSGTNEIPTVSAIVGCCLRNYISARLITVQSLAESLKEGDKPGVTVLVISNFAMNATGHSGLPHWQIATVSGYLQERMSKACATVVVVDSRHTVAKHYGPHIEELLFNTYRVVKL